MNDPSPAANICPVLSEHKRELPAYCPRRPRAEIIGEIAVTYGVGRSELLSRDQHRRVAWARQALMAAFREAGYSYPKIGVILGRDHATIIFGVKAHARRQEAQ